GAQKGHGERLRDAGIDVGVAPGFHVLPGEHGGEQPPDPVGRIGEFPDVEIPERADHIADDAEPDGPLHQLAPQRPESVRVRAPYIGDFIRTDAGKGCGGHAKCSLPMKCVRSRSEMRSMSVTVSTMSRSTATTRSSE